MWAFHFPENVAESLHLTELPFFLYEMEGMINITATHGHEGLDP